MKRLQNYKTIQEDGWMQPKIIRSKIEKLTMILIRQQSSALLIRRRLGKKFWGKSILTIWKKLKRQGCIPSMLVKIFRFRENVNNNSMIIFTKMNTQSTHSILKSNINLTHYWLRQSPLQDPKKELQQTLILEWL